jgi:uncharacterized membrane protein YeiH
MPSSTPERFPVLFTLFALLLGVGCGALHVLVAWLDQPDPLLSALAVTVATMMLGTLRPARPWRWVLLVGAPVPLTILIAGIAIPAAHFTRASIAGSILIVLPGFAGAYGGSVLRRKVTEIFYEEEPAEHSKS